MAQNRIERSDIIAPDALIGVIKEGRDLEQQLIKVLEVIQQIMKGGSIKSGGDLRAYTEQVRDLNETSKTLAKTQNIVKESTKQLDESIAEEIVVNKELNKQVDDVNGSFTQNVKLSVRYRLELKKLAQQQKDLTKQLDRGLISTSNFVEKSTVLSKRQKELTVANQQLGITMRQQVKQANAAGTSFDELSIHLGKLRDTYRKLTSEERKSPFGVSLKKSITELDKQVKANDESIGNFQRSVGNYRKGLGKTIEKQDFMGQSLGGLKKKFGALLSPIGAVAGAVSGLTALYLGSTAGALDFASATTRLKAVQMGFANDFAESLGADGKGGGPLDKIASFLTKQLFGMSSFIRGEIEVLATNRLADLEVEAIRAEALAAKQIDTLEELKQVRDDTYLPFSKRVKAASDAVDILTEREDAELSVARKRLKMFQGLLKNDPNNLPRQKLVAQQLLEIARIERENERLRTEAVRAVGRVQREIDADKAKRDREAAALKKKREEEAEKAAAKKRKEDELAEKARLKEIDDYQKLDQLVYDSQIATAEFEENAEQVFELRREKLQQQREFELENEKLTTAERLIIQRQYINDLNNINREEDEYKKQQREKELNEAIEQAKQLTSIFEDAMNRRSELRQEQIIREIGDAKEDLARQEDLADRGLANTLAFEQKKAAELEAQRDREAKKQEKRQKTLAYLTAFTEYLKENPNTAAGKALAQVAIAETVSGLFYEGTESVGDDNATKWRNTGRDDYLIGVHKGERIIKTQDNKKIGNMSNEDLVAIAEAHRKGEYQINALSDKNIVNELRSVRKAVSSSGQIFDVDKLGQMIDKRVEDGIKKTIVHKRKPRRI